MAHFLEADLQPWAAALAAALFAPDAAHQSTVLPRLASSRVRDAPSRSAAATAEASSAARPEGAWRCLEELRPLHGAVDAVLRAAKLPLLEQLPRTPAEWQPALIDGHVVHGKLELSYREAAACCDAMHAVRGVHALTLRGSATAQDDTEIEAEVIELGACTAVASLSTLRTLNLVQDSAIGATFPVWPLLLALTRLTHLAELVLHCEGFDDDAALGLPLCLPNTLTRLHLAVRVDFDSEVPLPGWPLLLALSRLSQLAELELQWLEDDGADVLGPPLCLPTTLTRLDIFEVDEETVGKLASGLTCLSRLTHFRYKFYGDTESLDLIEDIELLAPALGHLTALTSLQLDRNVFCTPGAEALAPALGGLSRLADLRLADNSFKEDGAAALASPMALLTALTALDLGGNYVCDAGAQALAPALRRLPRLADLRLARNMIGSRGAAALAPALGHLTALTQLDLSDNDLGAGGAAALAPALGHLSRLAALSLHSSELGAAGAAALASPIALLTTLTLLNLESSELGAGGAVSLAPALGRLSRLESLTLKYNGFGAAGAAALAAPIALLTVLTALRLGTNDIGADGAVSLAPALSRLSRLAHLGLCRNKLSATGVAALAPAIVLLTALTSLDLNDNDVGAGGAASLAPALSCLLRLARLSLHQSGVGAAGAAALAPALGPLTALTLLDLRDMTLGDGGLQQLAPALARLTGLQVVCLGYNGEHDSAVDALRVRLPASVWEATDLHHKRLRAERHG